MIDPVVDPSPKPETVETRLGPFARWPRASDAVLAVALSLAAVFVREGAGGDLTVRPPDEMEWGDVVFAAVAGGALYWRRTRPLTVLGVVVAAAAIALGFDQIDIVGVGVVALYSVGRYVDDDVGGYVAALSVAVLVVVSGVVRDYPASETWLGLFVTLLVFTVGNRIRLRHARTEQQRRERKGEEQRLIAEERTRIARELHDVVAHHVSLMTVQAGAAKTVAADDPDAAIRAIAAVESAGRKALGELRDLLDVLRPNAGDESLAPQPGVSDIPRLVDQLVSAGMEISLTMSETTPELPARVDLFAYRIVQEALTNVMKHAGPATRTDVKVAMGDESVVIEVRDNGVGAGTPRRTGHGLIGMKERARLLGGSVVAGPEDEGFSVVASLPLGVEPA